MKIISIVIFCIITICQAQFTLTHDGLIREYYVSYPDNPPEPCPLIINMHGYGGHALGQRNYSEMDDYAIPQNIAVVYPEGILNSWNCGGFWGNHNYDDVGFIRVLIDSVAANFNIDLDRVYACGFSNGGYMAYELACELADKIAAFGSVTGNFLLNEDQVCYTSRNIPIIDFHGTADSFVPYDVNFEGDFSPDGSMLFDENLAYWMDFNDLTEITIDTLPDIDPTDGTWVEKYTVIGEGTTAQFIHYKVNDGGHQWFGSTVGDAYISYLGLNNHDIHASEILIQFFMTYRLSDFTSTEIIDEPDIEIPTNFVLHQNYPNPFNSETTIQYDLQYDTNVSLVIYDVTGRELVELKNGRNVRGTHSVVWNADDAASGIYFYQMTTEFGQYLRKMVILK